MTNKKKLSKEERKRQARDEYERKAKSLWDEYTRIFREIDEEEGNDE